jgi:hypothetical protein
MLYPACLENDGLMRLRWLAGCQAWHQVQRLINMVEVAALIAPELLVEIEADAYSFSDPPTGGKVPSADGR